MAVAPGQDHAVPESPLGRKLETRGFLANCCIGGALHPMAVMGFG
jgi:hypothetical protein